LKTEKDTLFYKNKAKDKEN